MRGNVAQRAEAAFSRFTELCIEHAERREQLEWDTIASILADPARGRELAQSAGLQCADFDCQDMRLIYAATIVAAQRGKEAVLRLAMSALKSIRHWDEQAKWFERNTRWSIESLTSFACSFPGSSMTSQLAAKLIKLRRREEQARRCWQRTLELLSADDQSGGLVIAPIHRTPKRRPSCCR